MDLEVSAGGAGETNGADVVGGDSSHAAKASRSHWISVSAKNKTTGINDQYATKKKRRQVEKKQG